MKSLGLVMVLLALVAAAFGLQKWNDTHLESLQEQVVTSSKNLADFSDAGERLMSALGKPTDYNADQHQRNYEKAENELGSMRRERHIRSLLAFGVSAFFLLLGTIFFVGANLRQAQSAR